MIKTQMKWPFYVAKEKRKKTEKEEEKPDYYIAWQSLHWSFKILKKSNYFWWIF